jgi:hypothetical protein
MNSEYIGQLFITGTFSDSLEIISVFGCGVDRGFESLSGQIKDYKIAICSSARRSESNDRLTRNSGIRTIISLMSVNS